MKVIFHPEAHQELIESARFYEEKSEGLGTDFLTAVENTTRRIEENPEAGPLERANIRKRLVSGFPFTILYEIQIDSIFLAAAMHQQRRPGYWKTRIE
jgi:toxin ParE1/3/4